MRKKSILFLTVTLLVGCATLTDKSGDRVIKDDDALSTSVGRYVVIKGFISRSHEAFGIFFNERDYRHDIGKCVVPEPFGDARHGDRVTFSGILKETGCGSELICLNICGDYVLKQAVLLQTEARH